VQLYSLPREIQLMLRSSVIAGATALVAACFGEENFPVTKSAGDLQVTAKGWVWEDPENARLVFELGRDGKPMKPDAVYRYQTLVKGKAVEDGSPSVDHPARQVRLEFSAQPEERQPGYAVGRFRVPAPGKATVVDVPPKLKERGIIFAALLGKGRFDFRDGQRVAARNLQPDEWWTADGDSWFMACLKEEPSFVWIEEIPSKEKIPAESWRHLFFRGFAGDRRIPLFQVYPIRAGCYVWVEPPRTTRGKLHSHAYPLQQRPGQWISIEGFDMAEHQVDFNLPPPRPLTAEEKDIIIREFKIPADILEKVSTPKGQSLSAEAHHASLFESKGLGGKFAMYSPASQSLILKMTRAEIELRLKKIEEVTGFKPANAVSAGEK
jgi:hypothetical protein